MTGTARPPAGERRARAALRRVAVAAALTLYCVALYLGADYLYSSFLLPQEQWPRYPHPVYHHALVPNFDGYDTWGDARYRFVTNSLGFRDARVRDVPLASSARRVLLIGDSFAEGTGLRFEDTFAGRLQAAGLDRADRIDFLDAGVLSYSPSLYYRKVKYFLERGLHVDQVVVFSDTSDVYDEATHYFCQDDDPRYQAYCDPQERELFASLCRRSEGKCDETIPFRYSKPGWGPYLAQHFHVTDALRVMVKFKLQQWSGNMRQRRLAPETPSAWLYPTPESEAEYAPLGSAGGIERSRKNMQRLADLLKQKGIPLTIVVYPWPVQIARNDQEGRQVTLWRDFCATNCKEFVDLFPIFLAQARAHPDWYERLFIDGDFHYSAEGSRIMFEELKRHLL